ncbi:hypothetical protein SDC9_166418 [bioreactor metagenome]|uniref:Uncharacterized protein n=1 Tax=bioreactor metagenome TaxID=1076179 RepID=A0A645FZD1_9ZZZZ
MNRAPVLQIAAKTHGKPVHTAPQAGNGGQVGGGLSGVHVSAVSGVDDGYMGVEGGCLGRALLWAAHDDHVGVAGNHFNGVLQGFALCRGGGVGVGKAEHRAAHAEHGGLKGEVGAGGGLVEQGSGYPAPAGIHKIGGVVHNLTAPMVQLVPLRPGYISEVYQMPHALRAPLPA